MTARSLMRPNVALAALAGLVLRLFFVLKFPATGSGDSPFYIELAWNWLKNGVYGAVVDGKLIPLDARAPGYPAFLASVFVFAGNSSRAVMLVQAVLDLATCFLVAMIAARLTPEFARRRVALAALWLAALCPFTANYSAVVLTETLVTFLTALAILLLLEAERGAPRNAVGDASGARRAWSPWFLAGLVGGFGALVRPETPLLFVAAGLALAAKWLRPVDWMKLARAGVLLAAGLLLPMLPWAARNWTTLHEVQFLAPRFMELPGEFAPRGFNAWTSTWLWRYGDVYVTLWNLDDDAISINQIRPQAFDSAQERARVSALLDAYNNELMLSPEEDRAFADIARERTARDPLRTYLTIPLLRSIAMWFTPRVELLPYSGQVWPLKTQWQDDREDFVVTSGLCMLNGLYVALALVGVWMTRRRPGWTILVMFVLVRTLFFANFIEAPEPRYMVECFPVVIAFAAQAFRNRVQDSDRSSVQDSSTGSG
jgi:Dolichyl-phosphate-mannose-protein mannosyltransferase